MLTVSFMSALAPVSGLVHLTRLDYIQDKHQDAGGNLGPIGGIPGAVSRRGLRSYRGRDSA